MDFLHNTRFLLVLCLKVVRLNEKSQNHVVVTWLDSLEGCGIPEKFRVRICKGVRGSIFFLSDFYAQITTS